MNFGFFCDVTPHVANWVEFYRKLALAMKKKGRMAIIDYPHDSPHHPHRLEKLLPQSQAVAEAREAGFKLIHKSVSFSPVFPGFQETALELRAAARLRGVPADSAPFTFNEVR